MSFIVALALAVPGCGEDRPPDREPARAGTTLVAALGDSITAGSPLWDPDPDIRARIGAALDERSQYEYWVQRRLGVRVRFRNCGVLGETTGEIAERLQGCASGAQVLIVQGGINDIARGHQVDEIAGNLDRMVRRGKELGLRVLIAEILPWNNGHPSAVPAIDELNRRIQGIARVQDVRVLPFHRAIEDPEKPGLMKPEWTIEGDHPSVEGYRRLGAVAARAIVPPR
jgi:lysophospholipase L1-like esterase